MRLFVAPYFEVLAELRPVSHISFYPSCPALLIGLRKTLFEARPTHCTSDRDTRVDATGAYAHRDVGRMGSPAMG
jgi:hypothetical protein